MIVCSSGPRVVTRAFRTSSEPYDQFENGEKFAVVLAYLAVGDSLHWLSAKLGPKSYIK